ncbi:DUF6134 family protein [Variovorax sp. OV329]|uniref:DUF6134 family protein n=1 Tax=Variovorax sp. OV329 TaxID=1882825 RepID=UPI0008EC6E03|nr:DUF6134 family protein [Variovorax sp. OV329]SFN41677.1 hypothetical protein SAMN05444747_12543 [Variovorax sp. OV329]
MSPSIRLLAAVLCLQALAAHAEEWSFTVRLDGEAIGTHRFVLQPAGNGLRSLRSEATFRVRLLGVPVYRYRHLAEERWRGDCLQRLDADTDDDGERSQVQAREAEGGLQLKSPQGESVATGCLMSFAYWNPSLRRQARLLNVQTGRIEQVQWQRLDDASVAVRGQTTQATRWRLSGTDRPLDVWWTEDGRWVGLDATVRGGRQLSYRLD